MDSTEYDKIVDKLIQFRGKMPQTAHLDSDQARLAAHNVRYAIDNLLVYIDRYAELDILGWIK